MWSKLPILVATAVFLIAVCIPVTANDGRVVNLVDDQYDEHPWGGDHYNGDDPSTWSSNVPDVTGDWGNYYFTVVAMDYYWISIRNLIGNVFTDDATDNATGNGTPQTPPATETTGNPDDGARN